MFSLFLESICPNRLRICSKRIAISRPFFSPASVITTKCAERYSCHLSFSSEAASDDLIERAETKTETRMPPKKKRWYQGIRAMGKAARRRCSNAITGVKGHSAQSIQLSALRGKWQLAMARAIAECQ